MTIKFKDALEQSLDDNKIIKSLILAYNKDESTELRSSEYHHAVRYLRNINERILIKKELDEIPKKIINIINSLEKEKLSKERELEHINDIICNYEKM